jgi:hypothetical protein
MTNKSGATINGNSILGDIISVFFGVLFFAIGIINTFWGNDAGYGIFVILLSLIFFPPVIRLIKSKTGRSIPLVVKIILALFIIWSALGVAELFDKIDLMRNSLG